MIFYAEERKKRVLRKLCIQPDKKGLISPGEVAKVLSWRAQKEFKVDHQYTIASIRRMVARNALEVAEEVSPKKKLYRVDDAFRIAITPKRGERSVTT